MPNGIARITARLQITTPMFLGGGDPSKPISHIRGTSVRGVLAFWWRALSFGPIFAAKAGEHRERTRAALSELRQKEIALFGSTDLQAAFLISVHQSKPFETLGDEVLRTDCDAAAANVASVIGDGARYLGYGVVSAFSAKDKPKGLLSRPVVRPGQQFSVTFTWHPRRFDKRSVVEIGEAIRALGMFGGLGSRARRGYGSLELLDLDYDGPPECNDVFDAATERPPFSFEDYRSEITRLQSIAAVTPIEKLPITALGSGMRIATGAHQISWHEALNALGSSLVKYRGWGKDGKYGEVHCDQYFVEDHDWFYAHQRATKSDAREGKLGSDPYVPKRTAFGLPHNYSQDFGVTGAPASDDRTSVDRRASPLLLTVKRLGAKYYPVAVFLPTVFLQTPDVSIWSGKQRYTKKFEFHRHRWVIDDYLNTPFWESI